MDYNNYEGIIRYAMHVEKDGVVNYKEHADNSNNPTTKRLFLGLSEMEKDHYEYLKGLLSKYLEGEDFSVDENFVEREENIFEDRQEDEKMDVTMRESHIPDISALRTAFLVERDFKEFYQEASDKVKDKSLKEVFARLAKWEEGHEKMLKKEYDRRMKEYMDLPWGG